MKEKVDETEEEEERRELTVLMFEGALQGPYPPQDSRELRK